MQLIVFLPLDVWEKHKIELKSICLSGRPSCSFSGKDIPCLWPCFVTDDSHLLSHSVLIFAAPPPQPPFHFAFLCSPSNKKETSLFQKSFSFDSFWALVLHLSIKPTKDQQRSVQKDSPSFYHFLQGCTFFVYSVFFLLSSFILPSCPFCIFPLS